MLEKVEVLEVFRSEWARKDGSRDLLASCMVRSAGQPLRHLVQFRGEGVSEMKVGGVYHVDVWNIIAVGGSIRFEGKVVKTE